MFFNGLKEKFVALWDSKEMIEVCGTPQVIKGLTMPARKEKFTIYKLHNLVYIDMCPTLEKSTVYNHIRS
jgi:hypothetical protein